MCLSRSSKDVAIACISLERTVDCLISLYSGTPGSGKSLDVAKKIYWRVRAGKPCICNFPINLDTIGGHKEKNFVYKPNSELTPSYLIEYAKGFVKPGKRVEEDSILLVVDECQLMFNSREWGRKDRAQWLSFFSMHRHLGYEVVLVAQFDRMLDRQIRSLIEYEYIHRKVKNRGAVGWVLSAFFLGNLFAKVKVWYPMKEKVGSEFFCAKKRYYGLYDSYAMFDAPE